MTTSPPLHAPPPMCSTFGSMQFHAQHRIALSYLPGIVEVIENNVLHLRGTGETLKPLCLDKHHGIQWNGKVLMNLQSVNTSNHYGLQHLKTNRLFADAMMNVAKHVPTTSLILNNMNRTKSALDARDWMREDTR